MHLIGITGLKKSGKTTFAQFLEAALLPRHTAIVSFADALKDEVATACGVTRPYIEEHKDKFRTILQWWGTEFRRDMSHKEYWTSRLIQKCVKLKHEGCEFILIPDTRFHNEADVIKNVGGLLVRVTRNTLATVDNHPSEREQLEIKVDETIINSAGLSELKQAAEKLAEKLK